MKNKKIFQKKSFLLFGLSAVFLILSTVGGARAALTYRSENYDMQIKTSRIGVSLLENGEVVCSRDYTDENDWDESSGELLKKIHGKDDNGKEEKVVLGKKYTEILTVQNTGSIDSYVRVIIYKNWTKDGKKVVDTDLAPELINLNLLTDGNWMEDTDERAKTRERTILYYKNKLTPGETTSNFSDTLQIDPSIGKKVTEKRETTADGKTIITTEFAYDGYQFNVKVEVDAVQTHNAVDAIKSAWGIDVTLDEKGNIEKLARQAQEEESKEEDASVTEGNAADGE